MYFLLNKILPQAELKPHLILKEQLGAQKETFSDINTCYINGKLSIYGGQSWTFFLAETFQFFSFLQRYAYSDGKEKPLSFR